MRRFAVIAVLTVSACAPAGQPSGSASPASGMTFFVTSAGSGNGADLGGLAAADKRCQDLARSAGAANHAWHAYLSTTGPGGVNARDRIGNGPWRNYNGTVIAQGVADLHSAANNLNKQTALTEKGATVSGRGDPVNTHDILTGSSPDGRAMTGTDDTTCSNWTSGSTGAAIVGHHDRMGLRDDEPSKSWNSSHPSRGCNQENLRASGGAGLFYCFAVN